MKNKLNKIKSSFFLWLVNHLFKGTHFWKIKRVLLNNCNSIQIGKDTKIVGPIYKPAFSTLKIGDNCWIGRDFFLEGNGTVIIEDNCDIAPCVTFLTGSHIVGDYIRRAGNGFNGKIIVKSGSWLGSRVILLPNIIVNYSTIVGTGSVVTKNLEKNCIYGGSPAKLIKRLEGEDSK